MLEIPLASFFFFCVLATRPESPPAAPDRRPRPGLTNTRPLLLSDHIFTIVSTKTNQGSCYFGIRIYRSISRLRSWQWSSQHQPKSLLASTWVINAPKIGFLFSAFCNRVIFLFFSLLAKTLVSSTPTTRIHVYPDWRR